MKQKARPWPLIRRNLLVWAALLLLLFLSLGAAFIPLGQFSVVPGIAIAIVKSAIVAVLFMELAESSSLVRLAAAAGLVFVAILFLLTSADVIARVWSIEMR